MSSSATGSLTERLVVLEQHNELRFEVDQQQQVMVKLLTGQAECFGAELAPQHDYEVKGPCKLAVYSFQGAELSLKSSSALAVEYVSNDTVALKYSQIFQECLNQEARVLIIGEGRNTMARTFVNYAIRLGMLPTLVNLDVRNGAVLFPGILGALPSTPDRTYEMTDFRGSMLDASPVSPLTFFYGHLGVRDNYKLYGKLVNLLLATCEQRIQKYPQPLIVIGPGENAEEDVIADLNIHSRLTHIIVIGNERLLSALQRRNLAGCTILKAPKSAGYVPRDNAYRRLELQRQLDAYFYGTFHELTPYSSVVNFADIHICRVGEGASVAPSSALPLGATRKVDETRLSKVSDLSSNALLYAVMAVSSTQEESQVADSPAAGYVHVTNIDEIKQTLMLLCPCPGDLFSKHLLLGSLKWINNQQ